MTTRATWCPECDPGVAVDADDRCCAACRATATGDGVNKAVAALAEPATRDARRDALRAESMCAYGCPSLSFHEAAVAGGWDRVTQRTFDQCLQKTWREHVRTCPLHPQRKVGSLLKEALGAPGRHKEILVSMSAAEFSIPAMGILGRARQEGFGE